ncbi:Myb-like transcription factor family protein, putative isoform 2 [Hibiscus syriacus]|uniref:Myb-like transcription factor family protein, putative isoform 2 n=1 Tax=Hibiscus syriacus TaxID=106335 RepID=A0A6A2WZX7_HIBSY|nr:Myb-like transcription factor family protein, putative isoform 2 [Hibiscus syriacus]
MIKMDFAQKMRRCHEYVEALEEEERKLQVFQRELPLCLELVTQVAIETCKREISGGSTTTDYMQGHSDCSEQTTSDVLVLEEFIPIKKGSDCSEEGDEQESHKSKEENVPSAVDHKRKSDWLRSVQQWNNNNQSSDLPLNECSGSEEKRWSIPTVSERKTAEKSVQSSVEAKNNASATSTSTTESGSRGGGGEANNGNSSKKDEKEGQPSRKQRRCWSPELHRRFLHDLQQLGGSLVATPKQIRELMKVDGLTNDEVKSHLQTIVFPLYLAMLILFSIDFRNTDCTQGDRVNPVQHEANLQAPQFVVVGGIWVPPSEYTTMNSTTTSTLTKTATVTPTSGIYTPVATPLPTLAQPSGTMVQIRRPYYSEESGSHSEGGVHSSSPSTSSSTHTDSDSPAF